MSQVIGTSMAELKNCFLEAHTKIEEVNLRYELDWGGAKNVNLRSLETYLRLSPQHEWDIARCRQAVKNFKNFFALFEIADFQPLPTPDIAAVWATCVLHTELYAELCEKVYGKFIHHEPYFNLYLNRGDESERLQRTKELYEEMTGRPYDDHFEYLPNNHSPYD